MRGVAIAGRADRDPITADTRVAALGRTICTVPAPGSARDSLQLLQLSARAKKNVSGAARDSPTSRRAFPDP